MKEAEIMEAAREEAQEELQKMRGEIGAGKVLAIEDLKQEAKGFSKSIAEKILERSVAAILRYRVPALDWFLPPKAKSKETPMACTGRYLTSPSSP